MFAQEKYKLGYIYYETNIWVDNPIFRVSMIVLIVVVCLALIVTAVVYRKRRHRTKTIPFKCIGKCIDEGFSTYIGKKFSDYNGKGIFQFHW